MLKRAPITGLCIVALMIMSAGPAFAAPGDSCGTAGSWLGDCEPTVGGEIVDGGVQVGAETTVPGTGGGDGRGNGNGNGSGSGSGNSNGSSSSSSSGGGGAGAATPPADATPGRTVTRDHYTVTGPVTLSDLVNFRPAPGVDSMEPDGWMIVGLDTNFYATAPVQVQSGMLLDLPAQVRFTPVRYHWAYGDGATRSTSTRGATWAAYGLNEFDPTPTSHVYTASGTYFIDLTIEFAAAYRWAGSDWTSIAGTIPVPANRLVASAGGAKTVLVEQECTLNPQGPGC